MRQAIANLGLITGVCLAISGCSSDIGHAGRISDTRSAILVGTDPQTYGGVGYAAFDLYQFVNTYTGQMPQDCRKTGDCADPTNLPCWTNPTADPTGTKCAKYRRPFDWEASILQLAIKDIVRRIKTNQFDPKFLGPSIDIPTGFQTCNWDLFPWPCAVEWQTFQLLPLIGYEFLQRYDAQMDRILVIIRPIGNGPDPQGRNWGMFVFNERPNSDALIEIPHPHADWNSEGMGVEAFEKGDAIGLFIAGANRFALNYPADESFATSLADVAHTHDGTTTTIAKTAATDPTQSGFHAVHLAFLQAEQDAHANAAVLQLHGFNETSAGTHDYASTVIVSSGDQNGLSVMAQNVAKAIDTTIFKRIDSTTANYPTTNDSGCTAAQPCPTSPGGSGCTTASSCAAAPGCGADGCACSDTGCDPERPIFFKVSSSGKPEATNLEGTNNLQFLATAGTTGQFVHVESSQLVRGGEPSIKVPLQGLLLARTAAYAVDDSLARVDRVLVPDISKDYLCFGTRTLFGIDSNAILEDTSSFPTLPYNGAGLDTTALAFAHQNRVSFVGVQIESSNFLASQSGFDPTFAWYGHLHRERMARAGLYVIPIYYGSENAFNTGAADGKEAVDNAIKDGYPAGATIYLDAERSYAYVDTAPTNPWPKSLQLPYCEAYFASFKAESDAKGVGYRPAIYCSSLSCGAIQYDLTHDSGAAPAAAPVAFWAFNSNCQTPSGAPISPGCLVPQSDNDYSLISPSVVGVPIAQMWQYAMTLGGTLTTQMDVDDTFYKCGLSAPDSTKGFTTGAGYVPGKYGENGPVCYVSVPKDGGYAGWEGAVDLDSMAVCNPTPPWQQLNPFAKQGLYRVPASPPPPRYLRDVIKLTGHDQVLRDCVERAATGHNCDTANVARMFGVSEATVNGWIDTIHAGGTKVVDGRMVSSTIYDTPPSATPAIGNSDFTNGLADWSASGDVAIQWVPSGNNLDELLVPVAQLGGQYADGSLSQSFTVPGNATLVTFRYAATCDGTQSGFSANLVDQTSGQALASLTAACTSGFTTAVWPASSFAGRRVTLTFNVRNGGDVLPTLANVMSVAAL